MLETGDVLLLVVDLTHQLLHLCLFLAEFQGHLLVLQLLSLEDIFDFLRFLKEPAVVVLKFQKVLLKVCFELYLFYMLLVKELGDLHKVFEKGRLLVVGLFYYRRFQVFFGK